MSKLPSKLTIEKQLIIISQTVGTHKAQWCINLYLRANIFLKILQGVGFPQNHEP